MAVLLGSGEIRILKDGRKLNAQPVPIPPVLLTEGGLMNYVKKKAGL